jgi:GNAT superfamily N-acetyltransferase
MGLYTHMQLGKAYYIAKVYRGVIWLELLFVEPEDRRQGHATAALSRIIAHANTCHLKVNLTAQEQPGGPSEAILKAFYRSLGFEPTIVSDMVYDPRSAATQKEPLPV